MQIFKNASVKHKENGEKLDLDALEAEIEKDPYVRYVETDINKKKTMLIKTYYDQNIRKKNQKKYNETEKNR